MSQGMRESTENTLKCFEAGQEELEKLAFDTLNLSDMILNAAKKAVECLGETEEKEKAILNAKDCLTDVLLHASELSETIHLSENAMAEQREALENIRMALDFLCCEWDE